MSVSKLSSEAQIKVIESCRVCDKTVEKIQKCGRCFNVYYCGKECQKQDWPQHKAICFTHKESLEKIATTDKANNQILASSTQLPKGLKLQLSEIDAMKNEILRFIETSSDKEILLQLFHRIFSLEQGKKKLLKTWKKLPFEERIMRHLKFEEYIQKCEKMEELELQFNPGFSFAALTKALKDVAIDFPEKKIAKTVLETLFLIEASPDAELIMTYCARGYSCMIVEKDLKQHWSQLPAPEVALRRQSWLKIVPHYEAFVEAVSLMLPKP